MTKPGYLVTATYQQDFYDWTTKYVKVFHTRKQALKYIDDEKVKYPEVTYSVITVEIEEEEGV